MQVHGMSRRALLRAAGAALIVPAAARAQEERGTALRNKSAFVRQDWRDHFSELGKGAIACDTPSRALHIWSGDGTIYRVYPTSVPKTDELARRGYTEITRKIGRPSSDGCMGLYDEMIVDLFEITPVGTPVRLI